MFLLTYRLKRVLIFYTTYFESYTMDKSENPTYVIKKRPQRNLVILTDVNLSCYSKFVDESPEFDEYIPTNGLNFSRSTFYNGHIVVSRGLDPMPKITTADKVKCVAAKCDKDDNAGAVIQFLSDETNPLSFIKQERVIATVIMTETELRNTLAGRQSQKHILSAYWAWINTKNSFPYPPQPQTGTLRADFKPVFEEALQQVMDAKALVKLGRNGDKSVSIFETSQTNTMQINDRNGVITAYASFGFPKKEIGETGDLSDQGQRDARRRSLKTLGM